MAEILRFRARPRSEQENGTRSGESAQILFFTGVRYMRFEDETPQMNLRKQSRRSAKPAPRKPPRKRA